MSNPNEQLNEAADLRAQQDALARRVSALEVTEARIIKRMSLYRPLRLLYRQINKIVAFAAVIFSVLGISLSVQVASLKSRMADIVERQVTGAVRQTLTGAVDTVDQLLIRSRSKAESVAILGEGFARTIDSLKGRSLSREVGPASSAGGRLRLSYIGYKGVLDTTASEITFDGRLSDGVKYTEMMPLVYCSANKRFELGPGSLRADLKYVLKIVPRSPAPHNSFWFGKPLCERFESWAASNGVDYYAFFLLAGEN
jgi:hypothetical protein